MDLENLTICKRLHLKRIEHDRRQTMMHFALWQNSSVDSNTLDLVNLLPQLVQYMPTNKNKLLVSHTNYHILGMKNNMQSYNIVFKEYARTSIVLKLVFVIHAFCHTTTKSRLIDLKELYSHLPLIPLNNKCPSIC